MNDQHRLTCLLVLLVVAALSKTANGQYINVGLYPTAVPDSFEVRLTSDASDYTGIVNMTLTLRWEAVADGSVNNSDLASNCSALQMINVGGLVTSGTHTYFTLNVLTLHPDNEECAITPAGVVAGGIHIRELTGCRHVRIVNDAYTDQNNRDYYISVGGVDLTGGIATGPIASGSCSPCELPDIVQTTPDTLVAFCTVGQVDLFATATGDAVEYLWYGPPALVLQGAATMVGYGPELQLANGVMGTYIAVAVNDCGTDTAYVVVAQDTSCVVPEILTIDHTPLTCTGCSFDLNATVQMTGVCPEFTWTGPVAVDDGAESATVQNAVPGLYQLVASNACGSDTLTEAVALYTGCDLPLILAVSSDGPICSGDTLHLFAQVADSLQTVSFHWIGYGPGGPYPVTDEAPMVTIADPHTAFYSLTVTNACGNSTSGVSVIVISGEANYQPVVCAFNAPFDLSTALGPHVDGGAWLLEGNPHSGIYDPAMDSSGTFYYQDPSGEGCPDVPVTITEYPALNNGADSTITICEEDPSIDLFPFLGSNADPGGTWSYAFDSELPGGIYDPALFNGGTFRYQNYCSGPPALVIVVEVAGVPLYADVDGDGLGDPHEPLIGCDIPGYVSNSDDDCPYVTGTIGSPCDDGNASTENDALDSACVCVGSEHVGFILSPAGSSGFVIWPNPGNGIVYLSADDPRLFGTKTVLAIHDAIGDLVFEQDIMLAARDLPLLIHVEHLSQGVYMATIQAANERFEVRLVIK